MKIFPRIINLIFVITLAACGGGGGDDGGGETGTAPNTPDNLTAIAANSTIALSWDSVGDASSYQLFWSTESGFSGGTAVELSTNSYSHTGLSNDTTYYYRVGASNSTGDSSRSSEVSATPRTTVSAGSASDINPTSYAQHADQQILYNDDGVGLMVWRANTGFGNKLLYSIYQSDSWSSEQILTSNTITVGTKLPFAISSNGSNFALVYISSGKIYGQVYTVGSGWSSATELGSADREPLLVSDGNGFLTAWIQYAENRLSAAAALYSGGSWGSVTLLEDDDTNAVTNLQAASDTAGYMVLWQQSDSSESQGSTPQGLHYNLYSGSTWSGVLWDAEFSVKDATNPELIGHSTGYALIWEQAISDDTDFIEANFHSGSQGGSWAGSEEVARGSSLADPQIAVLGSQYIAIWSESAIDSSYSAIRSSHYNESWGVEETIGNQTSNTDAYGGKLASDGSTVAAVWTEADDDSHEVYSIYGRLFSGSWGTTTSLETGGETATNPDITNIGTAEFHTSWVQNNGTTEVIFGNVYESSWAETADNLVQASHPGGTSSPQIARGSTGTLTTWTQWVDGQYTVYARFDNGSGWGDVIYVGDGSEPVVAANDSGDFMIAWNNGFNHARTFDGNSLGESTIVADTCDSCSAAGNPEIASNGSGFAISFTQGSNAGTGIFTNVYADGSWLGASLLEEGGNEPHIAANGTGYCVVWTEDDESNNRSVFASLYVAGDWGSKTNLISDSYEDIADYPRVTSNGSGYAVVWDQHGDIGLNLHDGSDWGSAQLLESSDRTSTRPAVASDGNGYAVLWLEYHRDLQNWAVYGNIYAANAWDNPHYLGRSMAGAIAQIGSAGSGLYGAVWRSGSEGASTISANLYQSGHWHTAVSLESQSGDSYDSQLVFDGSNYRVMWEYNSANEPVAAMIRQGSFTLP